MNDIERFHPKWIPAFENSAKAFTILLLHGTGGDENDLIPIGRLFGANVNLLSIRGQVSENGMNRFFKRLGMGIFDVEDLKLRASELADFLKLAAEQYKFDEKKVVALGYSNGANIAGGLLLGHPGVLTGAMLLRPMIPYIPDSLPTLTHTKVLLNAGKQDNTMNSHEPEKWSELLEKAGANVMLQTLDTGHNLIRTDMELAVSWFEENFK
jgi:phospholipase/carboxylesterase